MSSLKKGTVPENGKRMGLAGSLSVEEFGMVQKNSKSPAWLEVRHDGGKLDLFFTPAQIVRLKKMIERPGLGFAKKDTKAKGRHLFYISLDLGLGGISVEVTPAPGGFYEDPTFARLKLKDKGGNETNVDLSLDVAREIRTKLDAYFAKERAVQLERLA